MKNHKRLNSMKHLSIENTLNLNKNRSHLSSSKNLSVEPNLKQKSSQSKLEKNNTQNEIQKVKPKLIHTAESKSVYEIRHEEISDMNRKLSEISLSHSSSLQSVTQQDNKAFKKSASMISSVRMEISRDNTPRLSHVREKSVQKSTDL